MFSFSFGRSGTSWIWRAVICVMVVGALLAALLPGPPKQSQNQNLMPERNRATPRPSPKHRRAQAQVRTWHKRRGRRGTRPQNKLAKKTSFAEEESVEQAQADPRIETYCEAVSQAHCIVIPIKRSDEQQTTFTSTRRPNRDTGHHDGEQHPSKPKPGPHPKPDLIPPVHIHICEECGQLEAREHSEECAVA